MTLSGALARPGTGGQQKIFGLSPFVMYGILAALVGIGGGVAIYLTQIQPTGLRVDQLQSEVDALSQEIRQKEAALRDRARVEAELKQAEEQRARLETVFGNQQDLKVALLMLDRQIRDTGAVLRSFKPGAEVRPEQQTQGSQQATGTQQQSQSRPAQARNEQVAGLLKKVTYDVELEGTFPQVLAVLRNIERLRLLLNLTKLSIEAPTSQGDDEGEVSRLTMKFTLEAFVPLTPEELAARKQQAQTQQRQGQRSQTQPNQQQEPSQ
ncbi:MAG: GspMb/PilO family protein [Gemmataceae bacterium]|nr:GspMb/PilO family protein [Gemmataceae bacterium]